MSVLKFQKCDYRISIYQHKQSWNDFHMAIKNHNKKFIEEISNGDLLLCNSCYLPYKYAAAILYGFSWLNPLL